MIYYFIYSAGGGAGDWNGVKRIWCDYMPKNLKSHILLKFGDIFFNHASTTSPCKPNIWQNISNLRNWLYNGTTDNYVLKQSDIMLDSGAAKLVNYIVHNNRDINNEAVIDKFDKIIFSNNIIEKYLSVINTSQINAAVTFDMPNPFKIRSQNGMAKLNVFTTQHNNLLIKHSAKYANLIHAKILPDENRLYTIINGEWSLDELDYFFSLLDYTPINLAVGGLSSMREAAFSSAIARLESSNLKFNHIHFLGCGGLKKVAILHNSSFDNGKTSIDCSTPINRSIDGSTSGATQSGYFTYQGNELIRISPATKQHILSLHEHSSAPYFTISEMKDIIDNILLHQSGHSSPDTYNARAKLLIHNSDVYRRNAEKNKSD